MQAEKQEEPSGQEGRRAEVEMLCTPDGLRKDERRHWKADHGVFSSEKELGFYQERW